MHFIVTGMFLGLDAIGSDDGQFFLLTIFFIEGLCSNGEGVLPVDGVVGVLSFAVRSNTISHYLYLIIKPMNGQYRNITHSSVHTFHFELLHSVLVILILTSHLTTESLCDMSMFMIIEGQSVVNAARVHCLDSAIVIIVSQGLFFSALYLFVSVFYFYI